MYIYVCMSIFIHRCRSKRVTYVHICRSKITFLRIYVDSSSRRVNKDDVHDSSIIIFLLINRIPMMSITINSINLSVTINIFICNANFSVTRYIINVSIFSVPNIILPSPLGATLQIIEKDIQLLNTYTRKMWKLGFSTIKYKYFLIT